MTRFLIPLALVLGLAAGEAAAAKLEPRYSAALQGLESVTLVVEGRVADGCWPSPGETKAQIEERLRARGVGIRPEGNGRSALYLFVQGYSVDGGKTCVWFVDLTHVGWSGPYSLLRGRKSSAQQRVRDSFYKLVDIFAADWALSNETATPQ